MSKEKKDVVLYFGAKIIIGLLGLLTVTLYSTLIEPTAYGEYSLISGFVSALVSIFIGWIGSSALRYYIDYKDNDRDRKIFFTNIIYYIVLMLLIMIAIITGVSMFSTTIPIFKYLVPTFIFTINFSFVEVFEKIFRANQKTVAYTISMIVQSIINIIVFYLLVKMYNMEAGAIFFSSSFSRVVFLGISFVVLKLFSNLKLEKPNMEMLKKFLKFGIPMIGVWGVSWILSYCDRYIIALFYDSYQVGIYDMSYKIAENSINVIITAFTLAIYPILINVWKNKGKEAVELKVKETLKYFFMLILPAIVGLICISDKLYLGILDPKYSSGRLVLIVVTIGMLFNGLNGILNKIWQLNEKTKKIFYVMLISVILNIVLNLLLIPNNGIVIAAITTLISYVITTVITYLMVRKEFKIMIDFKSLIKSIVGCFIMAITIIFMNQYVNNLIKLFGEIIIAIIIYIVVTLATKNIKLSEIIKRRR